MASRPYRIALKLKKCIICSIYKYNTLIDNEYFVITEAEDDIGVSVWLHMRIDRDWIIMGIPIYPTSRHY